MIGLLLLLLASLAVPTASAGSPRKFTIAFKNESLSDADLKRVTAAGFKVIRALPELGAVYAEGTPAAMAALSRQAGVANVSPTLTWKLQEAKAYPLAAPASPLAGPGDLYNVYQWDIKQVTHNGASWGVHPGSHATVVGIIDTGVNSAHGDLAANFLGGRNFVAAGAGGDPTETGNPADYADRHGHGTHVAGAVAGNGRIYGVGPQLGFRAYRVFGAAGGASTDTIVAAMMSAVSDGVDVISMSLGGYDVMGKVTWTDPSTSETYVLGNDHADFVTWIRAVRYAIKQGIVVVAAAGNDAINAANPNAIVDYLNAVYGPEGYHFQGAGFEVPGGIPGALGVSATGPDMSLASYSNYGAGFVDVAAPGGDFQRYPVGDWYTDMNLSSYRTGGYAWMAGTSMATPKVSAVAALYIDQYKLANGGRRPTPAATAHAVKTSAVSGKKGYDAYFGHGHVDAYAALMAR